jgi:hypothetical protein
MCIRVFSKCHNSNNRSTFNFVLNLAKLQFTENSYLMDSQLYFYIKVVKRLKGSIRRKSHKNKKMIDFCVITVHHVPSLVVNF